ncbi:MAG: sodium:proton antiporter [Campylobacteraceae bacterium]|nr:sodium:proton antiporter [Campylobacteraceae bacterium]
MQHDLDFDLFQFANRFEAAQKLLEILPTAKMCEEEWLVVAISSGGVPIANTICMKLGLNYDLLFTEPVVAPNNSEYAVAMVSETEEIVIHTELIEAFGISLDFIYGEAQRKYEEKILKYVYKYRKGDLIGSLKNKNVLLVDEGCETGLTVLTSIKTAISAGAKSVSFATPVIASNVFTSLDTVTDEIFTVYRVANFVDTAFYYQDIKPLDFEGVKAIIDNSPFYMPFQKIGEMKVCSIPLK